MSVGAGKPIAESDGARAVRRSAIGSIAASVDGSLPSYEPGLEYETFKWVVEFGLE
jgi:hypothetical protein